MSFEDEYRKKMIKQKKDYDEFKEKEGDSDLTFNEKDNQKDLEFILSKTRDAPEEE